MKESTEYEIQKAKHKRLLVRNEFRGVGKYDIPLVRKQRIDLDKIKFLDYTKAKINDGENAHKTVHFFMHDWKFDKVYDKPDGERCTPLCALERAKISFTTSRQIGRAHV